MNTHLILVDGELIQVAIEGPKDDGVIFRTMTGKTFFLTYNRFSFYVPIH